MLRAAVSLERIDVEEKIALAETLMTDFSGQREELWLMARLLGRRPLDPEGVKQVIPPDQAAPFIETIAENLGSSSSFALQALVNIAQKTGDDSRDLDQGLFESVEQALIKADADTKLLARLRGEAGRTDEEVAALYGDSLPMGLRLAE